MNIIAIDCGASFIKGAYFSDGKIVRRCSNASPRVNSSNNIFNPTQVKQLVSNVKNMILELAQDDDYVYLAISNEMHGFILTDNTGEPITDYISWQHEFGNIIINGTSAVDDILNNNELKSFIKNSGMPIRAGLPSSNLMYLKKIDKIFPDNIYFYTLGDFLLRSISGKQIFIHKTNAAATGLFDLSINNWNKEYIREIQPARIHFPVVADKIVEFSLNNINIKSLPSIGDQQAALLGAGLENSKQISFNLGTGAQVSVFTDILKYSDDFQLRPYFDGKYIRTIPHIPSGRALNVYFNFIKNVLSTFKVDVSDDEIWAVVNQASNINAKSSLKCSMSFFENAVDNNTKGAITNIGEHDFNFNNLFLSVLEQMVENLCLVSQRLVNGDAVIKELVFSGGIAKKFPIISERISKMYVGANVVIASDETLYGLYRYVRKWKD